MNHLEGGQGRPNDQEPIGQRHTNPSEAGKDSSAALMSIRADQDRDTFVAALRQNAEPVLSLARELRVTAKNETTKEEKADKAALGLFLEVALKQNVLGLDDPYAGTLPRDEDVPTGDNAQEWREAFAFWATERVALNWIEARPGSEAAHEALWWNRQGFHDPQQKLLREMWPSIRDIARQEEKKK
jgi:hypothetical protein